MNFKLFQYLILFVILLGVIFGVYFATMDQLPDYTGVVVGNTTNFNNNSTNNTIGSVYIYDDDNKTSNISVIIKNNTEIYKENDNGDLEKNNMNCIKNGTEIEVYTTKDHPTDTIPPQVISEKIIVKKQK